MQITALNIMLVFQRIFTSVFIKNFFNSVDSGFISELFKNDFKKVLKYFLYFIWKGVGENNIFLATYS